MIKLPEVTDPSALKPGDTVIVESADSAVVCLVDEDSVLVDKFGLDTNTFLTSLGGSRFGDPNSEFGWRGGRLVEAEAWESNRGQSDSLKVYGPFDY